MQDLTESQTIPHDEWVTLTTLASWKDVETLRLRLETNDIMVFIPDQLAMSYPGFNALGGIRVQIPKPEYEEARSIMKEWEASLLSVSATCPACNSQNAGYARNRRNPFVIALLIFLGMAFLPLVFLLGVFYLFFERGKMRLECRECKHIWKVRKKELRENEPAE